ncbi:hypothetical protein AAMO2058_001072500, partial [Amorphochlora amoebiformis]
MSKASRNPGFFIVPFFQPKEGKAISDIEKGFSEFYRQVEDGTEATLYYGFGSDSKNVVCKECYMNAEGILEHLKEVDSQLKSTLGVANLKSISFMGPEKDMKGVMDATKGLGPMYYDTFASVMWKDNFSPGLDRTLHLMQFFDIKEGKIEEAKKVFEELCQVVEGKDTDTLMYQFGVSGNKIMGQELFKDYGGLMSHM